MNIGWTASPKRGTATPFGEFDGSRETFDCMHHLFIRRKAGVQTFDRLLRALQLGEAPVGRRTVFVRRRQRGDERVRRVRRLDFDLRKRGGRADIADGKRGAASSASVAPRA